MHGNDELESYTLTPIVSDNIYAVQAVAEKPAPILLIFSHNSHGCRPDLLRPEVTVSEGGASPSDPASSHRIHDQRTHLLAPSNLAAPSEQQCVSTIFRLDPAEIPTNRNAPQHCEDPSPKAFDQLIFKSADPVARSVDGFPKSERQQQASRDQQGKVMNPSMAADDGNPTRTDPLLP
ncbi:hypothetical protein ACLOJK_019504 [Asimina triloba]